MLPAFHQGVTSNPSWEMFVPERWEKASRGLSAGSFPRAAGWGDAGAPRPSVPARPMCRRQELRDAAWGRDPSPGHGHHVPG